MNELDTMEIRRRRSLTAFAIAFVAWQVPQIATFLTGFTLPGVVVAGLQLLSFVGAVGFVWATVRMFRLQRSLRADPVLAAQLDDERIRRLRDTSFAVSFAVLMGLAAVFLLASLFAEVDGRTVAQTLLVAGVASAIGVYLIKDRS